MLLNKIYLYIKDPFESKYQLIINRREKVGIKKLKNRKAFIQIPKGMVFKLSQKVYFLQFCADISKKSKAIKAIYIDASERSRYSLSENVIVYYAMT